MNVEDDLTTRPHHSEAEVLAFLKDRSVPCPRCAYNLRDIQRAKCPECGEPLVLKIGSPQARFGWLIFAMAPGCFSGVAAMFVMVPIIGMTIAQGFFSGQGAPWPVMVGDVFGFLSAASVGLMYRYRHRIMSLTAWRQGAFAGIVWGIHIFMLALLVFALWYWY